MKIKLRKGFTQDRRLDRIVQFDERSRKFKIRTLIAERKLRSYTWRLSTILDQGSEGSCVGHGCGHELLARPAEASPQIVDHNYAKKKIYWEAQRNDEWNGGSYPGAWPHYEGTSVLAGVKVLQSLGWCDEYRWAFGLNEVLLGIGYSGPCILGIPWYSGMSDVDENGFIHATGSVQGGHCILAVAVNVKEKYVVLANSWGKKWGEAGFCKISFADLEKCLKNDGEACFLVGRHSTLKAAA